MSESMMPETLFESPHDPRWQLLDTARDRLATTESVEEIVAVICGSARAICSADGVTFVLRHGDHCFYMDEDAIESLWKGGKFPLSKCISGWAMLNARSVAISDVFLDSRIPHNVYCRTFVKSLIMVPVSSESPAATIGTYRQDVREFSPSEIAVVEMLAGWVGEALAREGVTRHTRSHRRKNGERPRARRR
jgi:GAF domain-containing protein